MQRRAKSRSANCKGEEGRGGSLLAPEAARPRLSGQSQNKVKLARTFPFQAVAQWVLHKIA